MILKVPTNLGHRMTQPRRPTRRLQADALRAPLRRINDMREEPVLISICEREA